MSGPLGMASLLCERFEFQSNCDPYMSLWNRQGRIVAYEVLLTLSVSLESGTRVSYSASQVRLKRCMANISSFAESSPTVNLKRPMGLTYRGISAVFAYLLRIFSINFPWVDNVLRGSAGNLIRILRFSLWPEKMLLQLLLHSVLLARDFCLTGKIVFPGYA